MKVISTNIGSVRTVKKGSKTVETGIFKEPVESILLKDLGVEGDFVKEKKVHGGVDKACYLFSVDHYAHWETLYPEMKPFGHGMFGENLTIAGLKESELFIGDQYQVGDALVEISEPRQPCYKFGEKMGSMKAIKQMVATGHCGTYVRVLRDGEVRNGDEMKLIERKQNELTIAGVFTQIYAKPKAKRIIELAMNNPYLADSAKKEMG